MSDIIASFARFGGVGLVNTALSLTVIALVLGAGAGDLAANVVGYAVGLAFSFFGNRVWTFRRSGPVAAREVIGFLLAFALAYGINLVVLLSLRAADQLSGILLQIPGMVAYSGVFFLVCRWFLVRGGSAAPAPSILLRDRWPEAALCTAAALTGIAMGGTTLTHDVVWQLWIARQLAQGAVLYRDIWELNPPLWFWSAIPVVQLAELLAVSPAYILVIAVIGAGAGSALAIGALAGFDDRASRCVVMLSCFWFMVPMPLFDFGQREQWALICALPYAALIARRRAGGTVAPGLALALGLAASYGFALKHYFLAIPLLLELWLGLAQGRRWSPLRPETIAMAAMAVLYATSVLLWAPDFLTQMVPMVRAAYHGYEVPALMMIDEPAQIIWLIGGLAFLMYHRQFDRARPLDTAFALVATGFAFAYIAQFKGWQYHALPVTGALLSAIAVRITSQGLSNIARYPLGLLAIALAVAFGCAQGSYKNWLQRHTEPLLRSVPKGEPIAVVAADPMFQWPAIDQLGLDWSLRYYSYWMLPAIGNVSVSKSDPKLTAPVAAMILRQTDQDLRCRPPALILIERREHSHSMPRRYFHVRDFFLADPSIAGFLKRHYREEPGTRLFAVYRRQGQVHSNCVDFSLSQPVGRR